MYAFGGSTIVHCSSASSNTPWLCSNEMNTYCPPTSALKCSVYLPASR